MLQSLIQTVQRKFSDSQQPSLLVDLVRLWDDGYTTIGAWYLDGEFVGFSLEDEHRDVKVPGDTRIPSGIYELGLQEIETGLTKRYRQRYPGWFKHHLHIKDIPGFVGVYIHIGNFEKDTDGCPLFGDIVYSNAKGAGEGRLSKSTDGFRRFYEKVYPRLAAGEKGSIRITQLY